MLSRQAYGTIDKYNNIENVKNLYANFRRYIVVKKIPLLI